MSIIKKIITDKYFLIKIILLIFGILIGTVALFKLFDRLGYELMLPYTWDSPIYWAVGRGILNGLVPYSDMYENKPPGVFLISALSFALTGDVYICSILSAICQLIVGLTPFIYVFFLLRGRPVSPFRKLMLSGISLGTGALFTMYCQKRSGQFQIETMGAAFICIYILIISLTNAKKIKFYSPPLIFSGFFLMCGVMFKEPFVIIAVVCVLLFAENFRDLLFKIIIPLICGGIMGIILLLLSGTFIPYFTVYIRHMINSHISIYGSPFIRGFNFLKIIYDLIKFSNGLAVIILSSLLFTAAVLIKNVFNKKYVSKRRTVFFVFFQIIKLFIILYSVSFCVGLGGQYFNHHYVFAVPLYVSALIIILKYAFSACCQSNDFPIKFRNAVTLCLSLFIFISISVIDIPDFTYNQTVLDNNTILRQQAVYVDSVLDACGVDRYQFLGFNGDCFYGFTKHSPLGPVFVQDRNNFKDNNTWFTENLLNQLNEAEIIIFKKINAACISDEVKRILKEDFIIEPPQAVEGLTPGVVFPYVIYYRIKQ